MAFRFHFLQRRRGRDTTIAFRKSSDADLISIVDRLRGEPVSHQFGKRAVLRVLPASAEYGIWMRRVDVTDRDNLIPALYDHVNDTQLCTRLANDAGTEVSTVEHLMAARLDMADATGKLPIWALRTSI